MDPSRGSIKELSSEIHGPLPQWEAKGWIVTPRAVIFFFLWVIPICLFL